MAVALRKLIDFARAFNIPTPSLETAMKIYTEQLADLPSDLLVAGVDRVMGSYQWGNRLPFPHEIRATVSDDIGARRLTMSRLRLALSAPVDDEKPFTAADRAHALAVIDALKAQRAPVEAAR
jgi:hypothetical protein